MLIHFEGRFHSSTVCNVTDLLPCELSLLLVSVKPEEPSLMLVPYVLQDSTVFVISRLLLSVFGPILLLPGFALEVANLDFSFIQHTQMTPIFPSPLLLHSLLDFPASIKTMKHSDISSSLIRVWNTHQGQAATKVKSEYTPKTPAAP